MTVARILILLFLPLCLHAKPAPDYRNKAWSIPNSIREVTTYSDKALISRHGALDKLPSSSSGWIHFGALPGNLDKNSVRVRLDGADNNSIEQVLIEDSYEQAALDKDLEAKVEKLKSLYAEKLDATQQLRLVREEYEFVRNLRFSAPFPKNNYVYQRFSAPIEQIGMAIESSQEKSHQLLTRIEDREEAIRKLSEEIDHLNREISHKTNISAQKWMSNVYVRLKKNQADQGKISLSYFVSRAKWMPVYDIRATLDMKKGKARLKLITAGMLEQHTGENWKDVSVTLSTLDPAPLYLPRFPRWSFNERREEAPIALNESLGGSITGGIFSKAEAPSARPPAQPAKKMARKKSKRMAKSMEMTRQLNEGRSGMADAAMEKEENTFAVGAAVSSPPSINMKDQSIPALDLFPLKPVATLFGEYAMVSNRIENLRSSETQYRSHSLPGPARPYRNKLTDSNLPAVSARGRMIELKSPFSVDLASDEEPLKIPLNAQDLEGSLEYLAIPKKDKRVFLQSITKNATQYPILSGKAQIFMNGDLTSKTDLGTINEGSHFTIDLGVDKGVLSQRVVEKKSKEDGLVFKKHSTDVKVDIEIMNTHDFPINVTVKDHYPLSPGEKIEVNLLDTSPDALVKKDGYITWKNTVKAGEKKIFSFKYNVSHPEDYIVSEFN